MENAVSIPHRSMSEIKPARASHQASALKNASLGTRGFLATFAISGLRAVSVSLPLSISKSARSGSCSSQTRW